MAWVTNHVAVTDAAAVIVVPADSDGGDVFLRNVGTDEVYLLGAADDSVDDDGWSLAANATINFRHYAEDGPLYARCDTGESATVHVFRARV